MKTQHTPGPFSISGIAGDNHIMAQVGHNRQSVAIVTGYVDLSPEQYEANKLWICGAMNACVGMANPVAEIAALRKALQRLVSDTDFYHKDDVNSDGMKQARAALALSNTGANHA